MRKRLRKKKHLKEFKEFGVEISIQLKKEKGFDKFWFDFITEAIERNNFVFGGGGGGNKFKGFIELGYEKEDPVILKNKLIEWLDLRKDIETYHVGELKDAWYDF
jgi:uncharacterized protein YggL (DUF469 family)